MKSIFTVIALCLFIYFAAQSQSDEHVVQLAAFETEVELSYFKGLIGVYHFEDHNNIHKYYIGGFKDEVSARIRAREIRKLGLNAYVINLSEMGRACNNTCAAPFSKSDPLKLHSIFFDYDMAELRLKSMEELNLLYNVLMQNPEYNVELSAHTDAMGSLSYNDGLSMRRAKAAKNYLIRKGVPESRLMVSSFGEELPIAKNILSNGIDSQKGRQFNRRVELIVYQSDGNVEPIVEVIKVPEKLKNDIFARKE